MKSYLNLGCGPRFRPDWTNIDFTSSSPEVTAHNLTLGIPYPSETFEVVYHSHVLEHFARTGAPKFIAECHRVLKPGGIIRVVVPDLESIVKSYLLALEAAAGGDERWDHNYEYLMLELYDQVVRNSPGGGLSDYLQQERIPNLEFVLERGGTEIKDIIYQAQRRRSKTAVDHGSVGFPRRAYRFLRRQRFGWEILLRYLLGREYELLELGRFRTHGEPHLWMYDRYSLTKLLKETNFRDVRLFSPAESYVHEWSRFNLDTEEDGSVYKPNSLYVEGQK